MRLNSVSRDGSDFLPFEDVLSLSLCAAAERGGLVLRRSRFSVGRLHAQEYVDDARGLSYLQSVLVRAAEVIDDVLRQRGRWKRSVVACNDVVVFVLVNARTLLVRADDGSVALCSLTRHADGSVHRRLRISSTRRGRGHKGCDRIGFDARTP